MKAMKKTSWFGAACLLALGCAETVPKELKDARAAYTAAQNGPAAEYAPADLHEAEQALKRAEITFREEGNEAMTRDRAYIASRKARTAEVNARARQSEKEAENARQNIEEVEDRALAEMRSAQAGQQSELAEERQRREAAEQRAAQAMAELARIAQVDQDRRGTVITIPGGVLFESGKADVLQGGQAKLVQVAEALTRSDPSSQITVEGHTDSQGSEQFNQRLSERRAESVRGFLISHGVAEDRVKAVGFGESQPVASNDNAEGRANNRRVEIIVGGSGAGEEQGRSMNPSPQGMQHGSHSGHEQHMDMQKQNETPAPEGTQGPAPQ